MIAYMYTGLCYQSFSNFNHVYAELRLRNTQADSAGENDTQTASYRQELCCLTVLSLGFPWHLYPVKIRALTWPRVPAAASFLFWSNSLYSPSFLIPTPPPDPSQGFAVLLCSPDCPQPRASSCPASFSQVLGLQVCVTMPGTAVLKLKKYTPKPCRGWTRGDNII